MYAAAEHEYLKFKNRKWVVAFFFAIGGSILGYWTPFFYSKMHNAAYNREGMDRVMKKYLGDFNFSKILPHELVIASYDYNQQEPRFYSKYMSWLASYSYDVEISNATASSAAAPVFFDPNKIQNGFNFTEYLVDGAVICNNPALYAYEMASKIYKKKNIRLLSLGTGEPPFKKQDPETFGKVEYYSMMDEFIVDGVSHSSEWAIKTAMGEIHSEQVNIFKNYYLRLQITTELKMDDAS